MDGDTIKACVGMACLTALGITALVHGIDHLVLFTIASAVGGLAGYTIEKIRGEKKREAKV
ncbi:MAG: hypothetical protein DRJ03_09365 [Chloroflexi bacterium]|nr:MAG: hypothetical protein DRJ03_09365 [Chloroflexota bacterium]